MPRVVHFEIFAQAPERAIEFYRALFGWTFTSVAAHQGYWRIATGNDGPGIDGGLCRPYLDEGGPGPGGWVCTVEVDSIDGTLARATACGARVVKQKFEIAGIGYMAHLADPEDNRIGLIQRFRVDD